MCPVLAEAGIQVAPSTYYARSKAPLTDAELDDAYLANELRSLWQDARSCRVRRPHGRATTINMFSHLDGTFGGGHARRALINGGPDLVL